MVVSRDTWWSSHVSGSTCRLLNLLVMPGGVPPAGGSGSGSQPCFVLVKPATPPATDLALGKTVIDPGTWSADYAPGYTVVRGVLCETSQTDCFCSSFAMTPFLTLDLASPRPVTTVVVRVSSFYPDYFHDVNVHVGDHGDDSDPLLTKYTGSAGRGEVLTLRGSSSLVGRYVSLFSKNVLSSRSLCLCLIQVYSV
ncbi:uncharacterized protein [Panulirus ornatus]|uniref:uncharacterized protein n=1 Tax=Panulirus ornatus TaxID=150431 RepID=UPI003A86937B